MLIPNRLFRGHRKTFALCYFSNNGGGILQSVKMLERGRVNSTSLLQNGFSFLYFRLLLCFMCCTTILSMWLSNTSTTAMVMPIVEAVLQELVNAEEDREVNGTVGNTIQEDRENIGT